jgi:hypothetical protein
MAWGLSLKAGLPSEAEWVLIIGFLITCIGEASNTFHFNSNQTALVALLVAILTAAAKFITQIEPTTTTPIPIQ